MPKFLVNDIDATLKTIEAEARVCGWCVEHRGQVIAPSLFPQIPEEKILAAVKAALRWDCNKHCQECAYNHPLLQTRDGQWKMCRKVFRALCKMYRVKGFKIEIDPSRDSQNKKDER